LLDSSSLYFSRVDQLGEFDPYEGFYPDANVHAIDALSGVTFDQLPEDWKRKTGINTPETLAQILAIEKQSLQFSKNERQTTFVNSWHVKDHESSAMWKLYLSNSHGVAIQSTYTRLIDSLKNYEEFRIFIGLMKYIDYETTQISRHNVFLPFIHKRRSFAYEDELRALIWTPQHGKNVIGNPELNKFKDILGIPVPVDLNLLIEKVHIAPTAPRWLLQTVSSIVKRIGMGAVEITPSGLASQPRY